MVQKYERDFKGLTEKSPDWGFAGPNAEKFVKFEPEGCASRSPTGAGTRVYAEVGLVSRVLLKGDFLRVTVGYEILTEPIPTLTDEAGATKRGSHSAWTSQPPRKCCHAVASDVARRRAAVSFLDAASGTSKRAKRSIGRLSSRRKQETGRLRMARTGGWRHFLTERPTATRADFRSVANFPFSGDDVTFLLRFVATTGGPTAAFDVRVTDLQIRADAISKPPTAPPPPAPKLTAPTNKYAQEYFQSFKGGAALPAGWDFDGPDADECVRFEPTGLQPRTCRSGYRAMRRRGA